MALRAYLGQRADGTQPDAPLFLNAHGNRITRSGVGTSLKHNVAVAATNLASLAAKPVSPHTLRHTTALHLLQSGVEPNVIKSWLSPPIVVRRQARGWRPCRPDGALLADLWDELVLPRAARSAWAPLVAPSGGAT